ncbi:hypothetical protein OG948_37040 (plasmid) [Embleya sp. NBC_00888]|uniref:hypothetical protein n=1 Tax=Embleya sp. NBC_00888 TaxID=2975960 RepID=UPI002F90D5F0|nr:hypothetical protein OG948_37040 [Embleya sp. NBC_00888]
MTTLGLDESVEILARHRDDRSHTGISDAADHSRQFALYFDAAGTEFVACGGIEREPSSKVGGQKLQL